ncbi:MAG: methionine--tRNA ligase [Firmicutes bacterium]|nr:methionine--tRNA ligase [Bacillota bacterium]
MANKGKYYMTTAIAYASAKPHIGNTYEIVLADAIARYRRLQGYDVFFMTGTDEHGQKIENKAKEAGLAPKEYVDRVAATVKGIWDLMNTSYDKFIRTTDEDHVRVVQKIFKKFYEQGDIYKSEYEGWYCVPDESFYTDSQLVNGRCPDCGREVQKAKEEAYFFKMSKYADKLMKYIEDNPDFIQPEARKKEMVNNFLKPGLQDLCVSRSSFKWGVPVDFDDRHVIYVWVDALSNYITGIGYDPDGSSDRYKKLWPADLHLIGKDILRFHTIYWPIFLMALGEPLPKQVFGHPWMQMHGTKMSKSRGNIIYADEMVERFGVDAVRYYMLREMPFASDGDITYEAFIARYNGDLANTIGNLVNRTIAMQKKYFGGELVRGSEVTELDQDLIDTALKTVKAVDVDMETLHVADAIEEIVNLARRCNKYIDETTPWALAKDEAQKERLGSVLYNLLESVRFIGVLLSAFLPATGESILNQVNVPAEGRTLESLESFGLLKAGDHVNDPTPLFARIDEKKVMAEILAAHPEISEEEAPAEKKEEKKAEKPAKTEGKAEAKAQVENAEPAKAQITIDDFDKVELKVGQVIECKRVEKSKKLLCSQVKIGDEVRQIVSGIAKYYTPEEMVGKKVVVVTNLAPAKLAGTLSEGMILCTDDGEGGYCLLRPEKDDAPDGGIVS